MEHPSNVLQSGSVRGFEEAMKLYVYQHEYEDRICQRMEREYKESLGRDLPPSVTDIPRSYTDEASERAEKAKEIYFRHMEAAAVEMRQAGLADIADCLVACDYSGLAI